MTTKRNYTLSADQAAKVMGVSSWVVQRYARKGYLSFDHDISGHRLFSEDEIREFTRKVADGDGLIGAREVAEILGVDESTVRKLAHDGKIPYTLDKRILVPAGRYPAFRFKKSDLEEYCKSLVRTRG